MEDVTRENPESLDPGGDWLPDPRRDGIDSSSGKCPGGNVAVVLRIRCSCGKVLRIPEILKGKQALCPHCSTIILVPKEIETLPQCDETAGAGESRSSYSTEDLYIQVIDTVVGIVRTRDSGSGVFLNPDGMIVTNRHVVGTSNIVAVRLNDGCELEGKVIRSFRDIDLAFVRIERPEPNNCVVPSTERLKVGQPVYAIGHPFGLQNTLTMGIVSAVGRSIGGERYIQTDAPINPGNSGGPLFNEFAELVGINTLVLGDSQGLGFAIPVEEVVERYQMITYSLRDILDSSYCGVCGKNSTSHEYCEHCGARIKPDKKNSGITGSNGEGGNAEPRGARRSQLTSCRCCGVDVAPSDRYCPNCGTTL